MIEVRNISKSFNGSVVLNNISAKFERGKTNLIIGQSGSGKTVLLKTIVGLFKPDNGDIYYDNINFTRLNTKEKKNIRKQIGMIFQGGALFDSCTVEENVKYPLDMFTDKSYEEKIEIVNYCLKRVNLINTNKMYPSQLSGGMIKRVAIARAIVLNPSYLFCDEPTTGLDPKTAGLIDALIKEITIEYNTTTIINTHDMNSVLEIGDKVIFINRGTKSWEGTKEEILNSDNDELNNFVFAAKIFQKFFPNKNIV
jgi:phospholipid/cholesterol/gamma-HCH transport system ATP-binding protein